MDCITPMLSKVWKGIATLLWYALTCVIVGIMLIMALLILGGLLWIMTTVWRAFFGLF